MGSWEAAGENQKNEGSPSLGEAARGEIPLFEMARVLYNKTIKKNGFERRQRDGKGRVAVVQARDVAAKGASRKIVAIRLEA